MAAPSTGEAGAQQGGPVVEPARLRLRRLKIHRFMDVEPGTELEFHDGINVILGKNGSGKTTLLELLSAVVRGDYETIQYHYFDVGYDLTAGAVQVHGHVTNDPSRPAGATHRLEYQYRGDRFSRELNVQQRAEGAGPLLRHEYVAPLEFIHGVVFNEAAMEKYSELDPSNGSRVFDMGKYRDGIAAANAMTVDRVAFRLDEGLDLFRSKIVGWAGGDWGCEFTRTSEPPSGGPRVGRSSLRLMASFGILPSIGALMAQVGDEDRLVLNAAFDYLQRLAAQLGLAGIRFSMPRLSITREGSQEILKFGTPEFHFQTRDRAEIHHSGLSFGERRLLAIYHYLACNPDVAFIDELVNGLHHSWIINCLTEIGDRQAFLASQNPLLLDDLPLPTAEDARKTFILCERDQDTAGKPVRRWRHMTEPEATRFYEAYEVGIQHVSEILRTEGLW